MKKLFLSFSVVFIVLTALASCESKKENHSDHAAATDMYTCPMHPEVMSDKPGSCPKCKMDLVKKENNEMEEMPDSTSTNDSTMKM